MNMEQERSSHNVISASVLVTGIYLMREVVSRIFLKVSRVENFCLCPEEKHGSWIVQLLLQVFFHIRVWVVE
jgi:hypothetical protein